MFKQVKPQKINWSPLIVIFLSASTEMTVFLFLYFLPFCDAENKTAGKEI